VSRLLDALRHLQQPEHSSQDAPARKVAPRLSASIRKAVLQEASATITPRPAPDLLFRIPAAEPIASPPPTLNVSAPGATAAVAPAPVESMPVVIAAVTRTPAIPSPDPLKLIEVIQASISSVQHDVAPLPAAVAEPESAPSPVTQQSPSIPPRPAATAAEAELRALLASEAHARPYREMLAMVQRDVTGQTAPIIAIVGLDGQESTEHVAAALSTLLAEQSERPTALVEANPARTLAKRYESLQSTGLTELLAGRIERSAATVPTSHERLDLLPFGLATPEQARLLPAALSAAIEQVRQTHAAAILDAGPLSSPWAMAASQAADAVYLVVRVGDTSAEHATGCVQRFRATGGKLTGCIAIGPLPA
jgi:Mrp family chromosome partitioning ATPase